MKKQKNKIDFHELRTPLTAIKGGVDLVLRGVDGKVNPKQRQRLEMVKRNVDRLARLIDDWSDQAKETSC